MFFVFNKEKIYSYVIAVLTVMTLFAVSGLYLKENDALEVSSNITSNMHTENNIIVNSIDNKNN